MISESWYWKEPLLEAAERLRSFKRARELHGEDLATIERDNVGFHSIRKLFEAVAKVTDATKQYAFAGVFVSKPKACPGEICIESSICMISAGGEGEPKCAVCLQSNYSQFCFRSLF